MTIIEQFEEKGITGLIDGIPQQKTTCPKCSANRKKSGEPCLSVNLELGLCKCHNCGYTAGVNGGTQLVEHFTKKNYTIPDYDLEGATISAKALLYLESRGISQETALANKVASLTGKFSRGEESQEILVFPFIKDKVINVKYRTLDKQFKLISGAESCFYGIQNLFEDGILATNKIYITEGELDTLSLYECGYHYALSVPNGANVEEEGSLKTTPKLPYLEDPDIVKIFESVAEIVLVTDADYKGKRLREELAQRLGIEKCYQVEYPAGCKDINDVLVQFGKDKVIEVMLDYQPMMQGLVTVHNLEDKLLAYYNDGTEGGMACGIEPLDEIFTTQHSQLIIVTGTPESMKSVCMDNITHGLNLNYDTHTCLYSPESRPVEMHIGRLASIHNGYKLGTPDDENRMPYKEYKEACEWVDKHYSFIQPPNNTLQEILKLWHISMTQKGTKIFVLDPYSKINWEGENEHQFIRKMLNELGEFASRNRVTVFLVAHPKKMDLHFVKEATAKQSDYKIVQPYDIAGSSSFYNSSDVILSLWKTKLLEDAPLKIYVQKSKLHHIAKSGKHCELMYNKDNWRLGETEHKILLDNQ